MIKITKEVMEEVVIDMQYGRPMQPILTGFRDRINSIHYDYDLKKYGRRYAEYNAEYRDEVREIENDIKRMAYVCDVILYIIRRISGENNIKLKKRIKKFQDLPYKKKDNYIKEELLTTLKRLLIKNNSNLILYKNFDNDLKDISEKIGYCYKTTTESLFCRHYEFVEDEILPHIQKCKKCGKWK